LGPGKYAVFDTFADDQGRNAHLNGAIAKALLTKADELRVTPPQISKPEVLAVQ
jgi:quinol monooxygenase YgiN